MAKKIESDKAYSKDWLSFKEVNKLTDEQLEKFKKYYDLLSEWNARINLTRIVELEDVLNYHFSDSLALEDAMDMQAITSIADVGSGGGFPGIPLKIRHPHLKVVLIEIVGKKISFLKDVVEKLGLQDVEVLQIDWRTFLRSFDGKIDLFLARASLQIPELLRIFKPSSSFQNSSLVYWASEGWEPTEEEKAYFKRQFAYKTGDKVRKFVFFEKSN